MSTLVKRHVTLLKARVETHMYLVLFCHLAENENACSCNVIVLLLSCVCDNSRI